MTSGEPKNIRSEVASPKNKLYFMYTHSLGQASNEMKSLQKNNTYSPPPTHTHYSVAFSFFFFSYLSEFFLLPDISHLPLIGWSVHYGRDNLTSIGFATIWHQIVLTPLLCTTFSH